MSILIVSPDTEAARSLNAALGRRGQATSWLQGVEQVDGVEPPPLVMVVDRETPGASAFLGAVAARMPWVRVYEMADGTAQDDDPGATRRLLRKPFDAAELATMLVRERELAELDRRRHGLQARAEELALLVEASFEAIVGLAADGTVLSWNRGATRLYGYAERDMLGRNIDSLEVVPGAGLARLKDAPGEPVEVQRRALDGRERTVLLSLSPVDRGTHLAFAETSLDVTTRRQLERELEHEKRLAAIGRIAAAMAHEINNPLAVVRAANAYVAEVAKTTRDALLAETVEDVRLAVDRIGGFVNHVSGFARRDRPTLSDSSLRETIRMALRLAKPRAADQRVELSLEPGPDVRLPHDTTRMSQAVLNLVSNAVDAACEGGGHVSIRLVADGSAVRVQVDDDGPGLDAAVRERAFEPFVTTKSSGRGTGLGLAITRQIVDDHGGAVTLAAHPAGAGTRAELLLPLVARMGAPRARMGSRPPQGG